jgi:transcriptional regulator with XRE-family HTH domain
MANKPNVNVRIGNRIRQLRTARGWSQVYLAELSGLSKTFLCNLETGQKEACLGTLEILADSFEISLSDLFRFV